MVFLCGLVIGIVFNVLYYVTKSGLINGIGMLWGLAILIPNIAICVRRLHDIGKSGWWIFISFIPIVGFIWLIVLLATKGK